MKTDLDFKDIGKRMPYRVPNHFFDDMENTILKHTISSQNQNTSNSTLYKTLIMTFITGAAAIIAIIITLHIGLFNHQSENMQEIEQAFRNLSNEDKNYMISIYQNDLFIN